MGVNSSQIGSCTRLFTSHGTVMFIDTLSGELRHGPLESSPSNVVLVREGERARLKFVGIEDQQDVACLPEYSAIVSSEKVRRQAAIATGSVFTYVPGAGEEFGLTQGGQFLSAESDGRITLSRSVCEAWERFHLRTDASGALVEQIKWTPVHGATLRVGDDGVLIFRDGRTLDWHLLRWTDSQAQWHSG